MCALVKKELKNGAFILTGAALLGLGVVVFLAPNKIATGGTPGMAILLNALSEVSIGTLMLTVNIPLLLVGLRYLGRMFSIRTVLTTLACSGFVELFDRILKLQPVSHDFLLSSLFGGLLMGLGVGCVLRGDSSAGGSTIIARILAQRYGVRPGRTILMMDMFIILSSALVFGGIEPSLWALISIYTTSRCIDIVVTGSSSERIVHIVTDRVEAVGEMIREKLGSDGTIVTGVGLGDRNKKDMIFIVLENRRISLLRDLVKATDPAAFVVVMEATDLMGRGH